MNHLPTTPIPAKELKWMYWRGNIPAHVKAWTSLCTQYHMWTKIMIVKSHRCFHINVSITDVHVPIIDVNVSILDGYVSISSIDVDVGCCDIRLLPLSLMSMFPSLDNRYHVLHTKGCGNIMWLYMCAAQSAELANDWSSRLHVWPGQG